MKIIRKMFPYRDVCEEKSSRPCFNAQLGLCPGVCVGTISRAEYKKNIANIRRLFEGKRTEIKRSLEKDMEMYAKRQLFEKAATVRNTLFALDHIRDISLIKEDEILSFKDTTFRIEAYDVAHISGTSRVGVMTVIEGKRLAKDEYRKFKLEEAKNDDYEGLRQIMTRRFSHREWRYPDLIVIDGGQGHKQTAGRRSSLPPLVSAHNPLDGRVDRGAVAVGVAFAIARLELDVNLVLPRFGADVPDAVSAVLDAQDDAVGETQVVGVLLDRVELLGDIAVNLDQVIGSAIDGGCHVKVLV
jgi:excinuclease UvrABC nuclease subunit